MLRKTSWLALCVAVCATLAIIVGCGGDNDPTEASADGSLAVLTAPESVITPWSLTGPGGFSVSGSTSRRLTDLTPGTYTLTWEATDGWVRPWPTTRVIEVESGINAVLAGEYHENVPSTVVVEGRPDHIGAAWTLRGSEGLVVTGSGNRTLADVDAGHYEVTWETPTGWLNTGPATIGSDVFGTELILTTVFAVDVATPAGFEYVPASVFMMGSPDDEWARNADETQHEVTLTRGFMMSAREVTASAFRSLLIWAADNGHVAIDTTIGTSAGLPDTTVTITDLLDDSGYDLLDMGFVNIGFNPARYNPDDVIPSQRSWGFRALTQPSRPFIGLSWYAAVVYCDWLSLQQGLPRAYDHITWECNGGDPYSAEGYRLPTEAEWEAAARSGSVTAFTNGPIISPVCDDANLDRVGWHCGIATFDVAGKLPNAWGFYDMHGNAWEWCHDWWVEYPAVPVIDPLGEVPDETLAARMATSPGPWSPHQDVPLGTGLKANDEARVIRGGAVVSFAAHCRSANRSGYDPYYKTTMLGFRPARTMPAEEGR